MDRRDSVVVRVFPGVFLVFASSILLFLCFPPVELYPLAFVSLVPLLIAVRGAKSLHLSFLFGYLFGVSFFLLHLFWIKIFHFAALPFCVLYLGIFYGVFSGIYRYVGERLSLPGFVLAPVAWVGCEFLRSIGPFGFPWGVIGYSQFKNIYFIQSADLFGVFWISFLVLLVNASLSETVFSKRRLIARGAAITVVVIGLNYSYGIYRVGTIGLLKGDLVRIALIQGCFDPGLDWVKEETEVKHRLFTATRRVSKLRPDLVVWTETAILDLLEYDRRALDELRSLCRELRIELLCGAPHVQYNNGERRYLNSAFHISRSGILGRYDKMHLVPFGEYIPCEVLLGGLRRLIPEAGNFSAGKKFRLFYTKDAAFAVLICFEGIFGNLTRKFVKRGADFMINITNDAWSQSRVSHVQHFTKSIFRAIENRISVVRAGNTGVTCVIDPTGRIITRLPILTPGTLFCEVNLPRSFALYTMIGDFFPLLSLTIFIVLTTLSLIKRGVKYCK